ncbi:sensor histidine kinase [Streptomyces sp. ME18-1-4]|uniref:sensor histidine kinase n=1 Tax=Streptomyces sp. ME18-1-4 TaxID=3028685 RepID=UPI0029AE711C|nr:histidine kinase [Streptomyces sp. ME18-1-4]MDX3243797.1 histidine kinase [Streptomyces sp. ME18-1-4]
MPSAGQPGGAATAASRGDGTPRPWWGGGSLLLWLGDGAVGAVVGALGVAMARGSAFGLLSGERTVVPLAVACVIAVRRRSPLTAASAALLGWVLVGTLCAVPVACWTVARRYGPSAVTWVTAAVGGVVVVAPWSTWPPGLGLPVMAGVAVTAVGAPVVLGLWLRQRSQLLASLRERAEQAERERRLLAARAVCEERTRIARELNDVVAHRISQMTLLAGALEMTSGDAVLEAATAIRTAGATALKELRKLVGVLGKGDEDVPLHPLPTVQGVRRLVDDASRSGSRIRVGLPGELPELPGTTERALYRLVEESLANAERHAPGAEVDVTLGVSDEEVTVSVCSSPAACPSAAAAETGFGLLGLRERVELAGGRMTAGPRPGGGFLVTASLPRYPS